MTSKIWTEARRKAGIEWLRFHDLRHEATSRFVEAGLSDLEASSITGHKSMQMLKWVLESINEEDFLGFSYGFRSKRNQHNALDALYVAITQKKVSFVLDADIKGFFDQIDQQQLMKFIQHRISDRRIHRLIEQTLQAGVIDDGQWENQ